MRDEERGRGGKKERVKKQRISLSWLFKADPTNWPHKIQERWRKGGTSGKKISAGQIKKEEEEEKMDKKTGKDAGGVEKWDRKRRKGGIWMRGREISKDGGIKKKE